MREREGGYKNELVKKIKEKKIDRNKLKYFKYFDRNFSNIYFNKLLSLSPSNFP